MYLFPLSMQYKHLISYVNLTLLFFKEENKKPIHTVEKTIRISF